MRFCSNENFDNVSEFCQRTRLSWSESLSTSRDGDDVLKINFRPHATLFTSRRPPAERAPTRLYFTSGALYRKRLRLICGRAFCVRRASACCIDGHLVSTRFYWLGSRDSTVDCVTYGRTLYIAACRLQSQLDCRCFVARHNDRFCACARRSGRANSWQTSQSGVKWLL